MMMVNGQLAICNMVVRSGGTKSLIKNESLFTFNDRFNIQMTTKYSTRRQTQDGNNNNNLLIELESIELCKFNFIPFF
jgi:homoaconitase/3-isopropylmalate dehydratase large subunit